MIFNILSIVTIIRAKQFWELTEEEISNFYNSLEEERKTFRLALRDLLESEIILKSEIGGETVGVIGITRHKGLPMLIIVVKSEFQQKGVGNMLMIRIQEHIEKRYKFVVLSVMKSNKKAIGLYKKFDYEIFHEKNENYYMIYSSNIYKKLALTTFRIVRFFRGYAK